MNNHSLNSALRQTARSLSIPQKEVESIYKSYWSFIKEYASNLPLKGMNQEEFDSTVTNFNVPYIGKLFVEFEKVKKYNNQLKFYQDVKAKENQACGMSGISD